MRMDDRSRAGLARLISVERDQMYLNPPRRSLLSGMLILNAGTAAIFTAAHFGFSSLLINFNLTNLRL